MKQTAFYKVNEFFEAYAHALENYDTKMMSMQYHLPCTFLSDEGSTLFHEASKLEGLFVQGTSFYKQFGVTHARPQVWSKRMWTEKICKVRVNWQYYDKNNQPIYNCDYQYILRLDKQNKWKIDLSVAINEKERMEEWLSKKE